MNSFSIYIIEMTVIFLIVSNAADPRIIFLSDCCAPFYWRTALGSSVLVTCNLIGATVWSNILFISSAMSQENTWM